MCLIGFSDRHLKSPLTLTFLLPHHVELCCCQVARDLSGARALTDRTEMPGDLLEPSSPACWKLSTLKALHKPQQYATPVLPSVLSVIVVGQVHAALVTHLGAKGLCSHCKLDREAGKESRVECRKELPLV